MSEKLKLQVRWDNIMQKVSNITTSWNNTPSDDKYPSEKLVKDSLDGKANSTHYHGNLQNNGQVGGTAQSNKNVVTDDNGLITTEDKPTIPSASSTTPSADTTNGSVGNGTTWARSNHTHPKSSIYAESTHTHSPSDINSNIGVGIIDEYDDLNSEFDSNFNSSGGGAVLFDSLMYSYDEDSLFTYDESRNWSKVVTLNDIPSSSTTLGNAYYTYEMISSTYNPTIDTSFTITVTAKDVFENPVANKSVTLYKDGTSVSSSTTNSSGVATWTITLSDWDNHHFKVANATLELKAKGWKTLVTDGNYLIRAKDNRVQFNLGVDNIIFPTSFSAFGGGAKVPTGYRPYRSVVVPCKSNYPLFVAILPDGTVERRTFNSSQQTAGCYAFAEWTI